MYSPKIPDPLIPVLYCLGQHRKQPMTQVVSELIVEALERRPLPESASIPFQNAKILLRPTNTKQEAA